MGFEKEPENIMLIKKHQVLFYKHLKCHGTVKPDIKNMAQENRRPISRSLVKITFKNYLTRLLYFCSDDYFLFFAVLALSKVSNYMLQKHTHTHTQLFHLLYFVQLSPTLIECIVQ